jgi:hypothetical protein
MGRLSNHFGRQLFVAMMLGMVLRCMICMVLGVQMMRVRHMGMMSGFLMITGFDMLGGFMMMMGGLLRVFGRLLVMICMLF